MPPSVEGLDRDYHATIAMSIGFGEGDFLTVGKLVWNVHSAYADAPEQFRNFSQEVLSLHIVIRNVEVQLRISGSGGTASGSGLHRQCEYCLLHSQLCNWQPCLER